MMMTIIIIMIIIIIIIIIIILGGYSKHLEKSVRKLLGARARSVLERMQKSVISNTLNIARTFKINT